MDRARIDLQILAKLENIERRQDEQLGEILRLLKILVDRSEPNAPVPAAPVKRTSTKQIVADLAIALAAKIPERNMAGAIARKAGLSDRQVRRLRRGK
jgi:hypothetical protein